MVVTPLDLLASSILREEDLGDLLEVMERTWWLGVEPLRRCTSNTRGECKAHYRVIPGVEHHLVLKVANVLDRIARSDVTVEGGS